MPKRCNPFGDNAQPQFKTHVREKEVNNGVCHQTRMQSVYDRTHRLLCSGMKEMQDRPVSLDANENFLSQRCETTKCDKSDFKQMHIGKNCQLVGNDENGLMDVETDSNSHCDSIAHYSLVVSKEADSAPTIGLSSNRAKDLSSFGSSAKDLSSFASSAKDLSSFGSSAKDLSSFGSSAKDLSSFGSSAKDLSSFGSSAKDLSSFGSSAKDLSSFGSSAKDLSSFAFECGRSPRDCSLPSAISTTASSCVMPLYGNLFSTAATSNAFSHMKQAKLKSSSAAGESYTSIGAACQNCRQVVQPQALRRCQFCETCVCCTCMQQCHSCLLHFCQLCSVLNYDLPTERSFCLNCAER